MQNSLNTSDPLRDSVESIPLTNLREALSFFSSKSTLPYPISVQFEPTLRCTAKCAHCQQWTWPTHSELSELQLRNLISVFQKWGVSALTISGGNPLLYPHLPLLLRQATKAGMRVGMISEGPADSNLHPPGLELLEWARFSVDGPTAEIHDRIRNTPGLFTKTTEFASQLKQRSPKGRVGLSCVVQSANITSVDLMLQLAERLGVDAIALKLPHSASPSTKFLPSTENWRNFITWLDSEPERSKNIQNNLAALRGFIRDYCTVADLANGTPVQTHYQKHKIKCFTPLFHVVVDSEANLYPCCYLQYDNRLWNGPHANDRKQHRLGNLLDDELGTMNNLANALREKIHKYPTNSHAACGGCTRHAYLNTALTRLDKNDKLQSHTMERTPSCQMPHRKH